MQIHIESSLSPHYYLFPFHSIPFHSIPFHSLQFNSIQFLAIQFNSPYNIQFCCCGQWSEEHGFPWELGIQRFRQWRPSVFVFVEGVFREQNAETWPCLSFRARHLFFSFFFFLFLLLPAALLCQPLHAQLRRPHTWLGLLCCRRFRQIPGPPSRCHFCCLFYGDLCC